MPECFICSRRAKFYHHGHWWCEKHRNHIGDGEEAHSDLHEIEGDGKKIEQVELGLDWV